MWVSRRLYNDSEWNLTLLRLFNYGKFVDSNIDTILLPLAVPTFTDKAEIDFILLLCPDLEASDFDAEYRKNGFPLYVTQKCDHDSEL